jgi:hypothetical protein
MGSYAVFESFNMAVNADGAVGFVLRFFLF